MRSFLTFAATLLAGLALLALAHLYLGAEVGEACNDFALSCRGTRGLFTLNACVHVGPDPEDAFCSYACEEASECPDGWTCEPAAGWSTIPNATEDVDRVCRRPR